MSQRMKAIATTVTRSAPNPDRPKLSDELERQLHESDQARAVSYAQLEDVTERMKEVADDLSYDGDDGAVPIEVEADEETSLVTAIEQMKQGAR